MPQRVDEPPSWVRRVGLACAALPDFVTPGTVACRSPLPSDFQQECRRRVPFPSPGDLPGPGIEPPSLASPDWQEASLPLSLRAPGSAVALSSWLLAAACVSFRSRLALLAPQVTRQGGSGYLSGHVTHPGLRKDLELTRVTIPVSSGRNSGTNAHSWSSR